MSEQPTTTTPTDIEKPACFYLGRDYDLGTKALLPGDDHRVEYEARNLTTHGVIIGMTGSGKTGLSIALLEEAAIDGIPAVIIDPKGDLTNLLLQFDGLEPRKFEKWLNPEDARQKGLSVPDFARELSERWKKGLLDTEQPLARTTYAKREVDYRIYTPGSESGLPLSILGDFEPPGQGMSPEDVNQKIHSLATALLGLTGISTDPLQSREHILIAQLLQHAWSAGKGLDLRGLIEQVQTPPIRQVGAYNLETFFPAKDRVKLATQLNNVLASPVFATWRQGEPLDFGKMLIAHGRPRHLIFYVAHLDDTQRMFFVTLLLEEMLAWTRRQSGTTTLRALLYFDEVFGYLPPHPGNPPSKQPLLTLLKQARAFGVGVLLATQNPVDLDYKALSNAGTWFVGKLQTERDKARLLDGLESVAAEYGTMTDRNYLEKVIASLGNRVFLLHNINQGKPRIFQTKWALSFLRGPMTREQVSQLMAPVKAGDRLGAATAVLLCQQCGAELQVGVANRCPKCGKDPTVAGARPSAPVAQWLPAGGTTAAVAVPAGPAVAAVAAVPVAPPPGGAMAASPPMLPPDVTQFYLEPAARPGRGVAYRPMVLGCAEVVFLIDKRTGREHRETVQFLAAPPAGGHPIAWGTDQKGLRFATGPLPGSQWASVPESLDTGKKLKALEKGLADHLYSTQKLPLFENRTLEMIGEKDEPEATFRERCRLAALEEAKKALEMERVKFTPKFDALGVKVPQAPNEAKQGRGLLDWILTLGASPKKVSAPPADKQEEKVRKLEADYQSKRNEVAEKWKRAGEEVTPIQVKPRKADVRITHFGLAWVPG